MYREPRSSGSACGSSSDRCPAESAGIPPSSAVSPDFRAVPTTIYCSAPDGHNESETHRSDGCGKAASEQRIAPVSGSMQWTALFERLGLPNGRGPAVIELSGISTGVLPAAMRVLEGGW